MDNVFRAVSDSIRRQLLDRLNERNGQTLRELCAGLDIARQSVSKHLAVLEAANLVTTIRRGREKLHYLDVAPLNAIAQRWITQYDQQRVDALAGLKPTEAAPVRVKPSFVYSTYIKTTPKRLWQALTGAAFTQRYWGITLESDWEAGSPIAWHHRGVTITDPEQIVLVSEPYRQLSYTWPTFAPGLAKALNLTDRAPERLAAELRSRVTFAIEAFGERVKLTVIHEGFEQGQQRDRAAIRSQRHAG
jgi:DNA-binding transcriptional ArsR family regulator/uncharacterized protein YndB with AHSA1/START domain